MTTRILLALAALSLTASAIGAESAQTYPNRPIKFIVPGAPGGGGDLVGRLIGEGLTRRLQQPMVIDNNAGASGTIATNQVVRAKPDGYTIGLGLFTPTILAPVLYANLPYDPLKDLTIVGGIGASPIMLVVSKDFPANDLQEFVQQARKSPTPLHYGSWGIGSTGHFCGEVLAQKTNIKLNHVPYKGAAPVVVAMYGGEINAAYIDVATGTAAVKSGKIKPLAMCTRRTASFPTVATYKEQGVDFDQWTGWTLIAPVGMPKPVLDSISAALEETVKDPAVAAKLLDWGITADFLSGTEQMTINRSSVEVWRKVARDAGMKAE